jgi:methionine biosynthesis protein MetW
MIRSGSSVVDFGSGDGTLALLLMDARQCTVVGVELDEPAVAAARQRGVRVLKRDLNLGLADLAPDTFDYTVCSVTLQLLMRPDQIIYESLRVSPQAIISFPNFGFWLSRIQVLAGRYPRAPLHGHHWFDTKHIHLFSYRDFRDLCANNRISIDREVFLGSHGRRVSRVARLWPNLLSRVCIVALSRGA